MPPNNDEEPVDVEFITSANLTIVEDSLDVSVNNIDEDAIAINHTSLDS